MVSESFLIGPAIRDPQQHIRVARLTYFAPTGEILPAQTVPDVPLIEVFAHVLLVQLHGLCSGEHTSSDQL